jgi:hypothetical protein
MDIRLLARIYVNLNPPLSIIMGEISISFQSGSVVGAGGRTEG